MSTLRIKEKTPFSCRHVLQPLCSMILIGIMLMALTLSSCSSNNRKEINPTSTEFSDGNLSDFVDIVDQPCVLTISKQEGDSEKYTLRLTVTLQKKNNDFTDVDADNLEFSGWYYASVNFVDDAGAKVLGPISMASESKAKLKKLIVSPTGKTTEIVFEDFYYNSDAPKWFKSIDGFTPYDAAKVYVEDAKSTSSQTYTYVESSSSTETDDNSDDDTIDINNVLLPSSLKGKVEVISAEKSVSGYGYPEVSITFKLLKKVNTASMCSSYGQMWIVGVGQTETGKAVKELLPNYGEWRTGDSDGSEFKAFLEGDPDDTITLDFTGDDGDNVSENLDKVKKFKLTITN